MGNIGLPDQTDCIPIKVDIQSCLVLKSRHNSMNSQEQSKKRCSLDSCNKKLGLCGFACKCQKEFCLLHRDPLLHKCTFDFHAEAKNNLLRTMSTAVVGKKVEVI